MMEDGIHYIEKKVNKLIRFITHDELNKILENHKHWINEDCDGWESMMADLHGADLHGAVLHWANLYGANLYGANLYEADLHGANLYGANLHGVKHLSIFKTR